MAQCRHFLSLWRRPLTSKNSHFHRSTGVRIAEQRAIAHVLARSLCRFKYVAFQQLPRSEQLNFLQVQLQAWQPFQESEFAVIIGSEAATVFAWDQRALLQRCEASSIPVRGMRLLPESLLQPALANGVVLRQCAEGVEGQVWRSGALLASRWWAQPPELDGWLNFQRGAGVAAPIQAFDVSIAESEFWSGEPFADVQTLSAMMAQGRLYLLAGFAAVSLVLALPTFWLLKSWIAADERVVALTAEKQQLETLAHPVLHARSEALDALATLEAMEKLVEHPNPVVLLAHLSRLLPDGTTVQELELKGNRLQLVLLAAPGASRVAYVKAFESGGWLHNVHEISAENTHDGIVLVAELQGSSPAQKPSAPSTDDKSPGDDF